MISSVPSYDEELLNSAYANIGLIADKGWAFHQDDPFRKLNHTLWVQNCKLNARYRENGNYQPRCVRNTIPGSWLAQYGNYEYNEERERMYKPGDNMQVIRQPDLYNGPNTEPWMLEEVEEHFTRLSFGAPLPLDDELSTQPQSSATDRLDLPGKVTARETGRIEPKWDVVLRKRYSTLEQVLAAKTSSGKESAPRTSYITNIDEPYQKNVDPEDYIKYPPLRYTVDNMAEMQLQIHVTSDAVRDLWNPLKSPQQQQQQKYFHYSHRHQQHPQCGGQQQHHLHCNKQQQYLQCGMQHQTLALRPGRQSFCPESMGMMRQPPPPMLSAEVPEFFPKGPMCRSKVHQEQSIPLRFFPSSAERCYQDELFPYNRGHIPGSGNVYQSASMQIPRMPIQQVANTSSLTRPSHQWIQRPSPALHVQVPVCPPPHQSVCPTIIQRRIEMHDKLAGNMTPQGGLASVPIPVYQRPPELYSDPSQRRKNQGVDYNNLILLTKNAMKARRNQSKNSQQSASFIVESRQPNLKSETEVLQWLEKGYPKKAKDFVAVNILVSDLQNFEAKCDDGKTVTVEQSTEDIRNPDMNDMYLTALNKPSGKFSSADPSSDLPTKRRLYRDVLTNSLSTGIVLENVFDKRYDELERQAMEQYRTSEECLALRYQELERQAMEQYRNGDNTAGSTSIIQSQSSSPASPAKGKPRDESKSVTEDKECVGGHKCSGFGHCSPIKDSPSASEKGTPTRKPLTILRPESKPGTSATHRVADRNECSRPAVVTKSLTTLSQRFARDSKNTTKGASGDKIDRTVQPSPKRRLILMSPSKRESEAKPTKTSDLEEMYAFQSDKTHVSGSCRRPEVIEAGGGDEKVTVLRSPGSEGIREQLFLGNEELMDNSSESLGVRLLEPTEIDGPYAKLDVIENLKEQTIDVFSGASINIAIDAGREDEEASAVAAVCRTIWKQPQEHQQMSSRITRNKKKQCKPHNHLVAAEEINIHRPDSLLTKSITFSPRDEKYGVERVDIIPHDNVTTSKVHHGLRKPNLKLKLKSKCRKMCPLPHFPPTTFEKWKYLTVTDFLSCSSSILEATDYCVSLCNTTNVEISKIFIYNDSHLFPKRFEFNTTQIYFRNKISPQNMLMVRRYEILPAKGNKTRSPSYLQILPSWDSSQVNDLRDTISSGMAPRRIQTNNLSSVDDCTKSCPAKFRHEAICEFHFDLDTLRLFPPVSFIPIFDGEQNLHLYRKANVYYIMTDLDTMFPFSVSLTSNVNRKLRYL